MLTIKKVATVVSNYQEEASESAAGCGRNCLGKCCLPVSKLPLYAFKKDGENSNRDEEEPGNMGFLHNLLLGQWEDRMNRGLFRYDVTACDTKVILGRYGFIAQLNEGRHLKKRPTEFRVDKVLQPFDEAKFNFTKVGQEEVLFRFEQSCDHKTHFFTTSPAPTSSVDTKPHNVVAINVSPIEYGHVLLIPRILDCVPQRIDHESFLVALHMAREAADPFFRLGYNSLGAFATINHLHFQAYYLAIPFPVERVLTRKLAMKGLHDGDRGVMISQLVNYPVQGLVFEGGNSLLDLSTAVADSCILLQNSNIPFNVLISDCGKKVFLFPQCYAEKQALGEVSQELLDTQVNPAVWEISGHMVLKRRKDYEEASEVYACRLLAEVSLPEERFQEVVKIIMLEALPGSPLPVTGVETDGMNEEDNALYKAPAQHISQDCIVLQ
ncbi:GDP-L-galactose phosphorylase 2-like [Malania oleifera]|uniref:GDP-L-galactose phosphorylase 2-like n=1 Tax=Malania oleifera TaxID=397392 RepID=UPI0025AE2742|nr:GDP-L-galactose phosphorylase 2-like [Malania oleifera]